MLPGFLPADCPDLAVPVDVMRHVVQVESSHNPYAIGVVGARLARQPRDLQEAVATARMLERRGYDFSVGLAQVNRRNFARQGLDSYEKAFDACPNLQAGARILADCRARAGGDWGRAFSCYYSGNFTTGFRHGYVRRVFASMGREVPDARPAIGVVERQRSAVVATAAHDTPFRETSRSLVTRRAATPVVVRSSVPVARTASPVAGPEPATEPYAPDRPGRDPAFVF